MDSDIAKAAGIRRAGWAAVVLGVLLVGGMGFLTITLAPGMLWPNQTMTGTQFTGTHQEAVSYVTLFGMVILLGVVVLIAGAGMIRTGQRNKVMAGITIGLFVMLLGFVWKDLLSGP